MRDELLADLQDRIVCLLADKDDPDTALFGEAIELAERLMRAIPDPASDLHVLHALGWLHWCGYLILAEEQKQAHLTASLEFLEPVYRSWPDAVPDQLHQLLDTMVSSDATSPEALADRGMEFLEQAMSTGDSVTLDVAVDVLERALDVIPHDHPKRALYLSGVGLGLRQRFERTRRLEDLDRAITVIQEAADATPEDDPFRSMSLAYLGTAIGRRFEMTGALGDLDRAINATEEAAEGIPQGHPVRAAQLSVLASFLLRRFERIGMLEDVERAVDVMEEAVRTTPEGDTDRAGHLSGLGAALKARFERTGRAEDLDRAVDLGVEAMAATPQGDADRAFRLARLGNALERRFERTATLEDLDRAVELIQEAAGITPQGHPDRSGYLSNLGVALRARFGRTGSVEDLDRAVDVMEEAAGSIPQGQPDRSGYLSHLGVALRARFGRTGSVEDLDRAVDVAQNAVDSSPKGDPSRAGYQSNLGFALRLRSWHAGALEDLDRAITVTQEAVDATPQDDRHRAGFRSNLGAALRARFERTGALEDLDRAITVTQEAVDATPQGHSNRALYLDSLGAALLNLYDRTGTLEDLDRAIDVTQEAVRTTPQGHDDRSVFLSNLGSALERRFERTGALEDLDRAISVIREAVEATPEDDPDRAGCLSMLGIAMERRFERTGSLEDLDRGVGGFRKAAGVVSAPVDVRANAARGWGRLAVAAAQWVEAVEGFSTAVGLTVLVASRGLGRADQEFRLGQLEGLGSEAAAACVQAGQPGRAVELFEQGRGVLFSQVLDARTDLTDLEESHPELADEFAHWRDELDRRELRPSGLSTSDADAGTAARLAADRRREVAAEFERVLSRIRDLPGFKRFLTAWPVQELIPAAAGGQVVLINVAPLRSDALILTTDGVEMLPLGGVDPGGVIEQAIIFLGALTEVHDAAISAAARTAAEAQLGGVLGWLWDKITGPILDHLGYTIRRSNDADWPRVWWCPSGPLSLLPLHAAGHHDLSRGRPDAVIDRVISSTIPTVRALLHARQAPPPSRDTRVLVVAMPQTPGQADLPGAAQEAVTLHHLLAGRVDVLGLADSAPATYDTVTAALPGHTWVHFCCHGQSNLTDPSASHLLLADYQTRPLTVVDLTQARLQDVELAFLSACTTARTGAALPDEPIHLAAACQLAGYRHVIATLWPISDADTAWLTKRFYTTITTTQTSTAASALHHATRQLRSTNRTHPSHWAPYTHTGP